MMASPSGLWQVSKRAQMRRPGCVTDEAKATSRPEGAIVAEPTMPSTWMVPSASKLSLSKADLRVLTFLGSSERLS